VGVLFFSFVVGFESFSFIWGWGGRWRAERPTGRWSGFRVPFSNYPEPLPFLEPIRTCVLRAGLFYPRKISDVNVKWGIRPLFAAGTPPFPSSPFSDLLLGAIFLSGARILLVRVARKTHPFMSVDQRTEFFLRGLTNSSSLASFASASLQLFYVTRNAVPDPPSTLRNDDGAYLR